MICPCCKHHDLDWAFARTEWMPWSEELETDYYACNTCGLGLKNPMPDQEKMRAYYQSGWQYPSRKLTSTARWLSQSLRAQGVIHVEKAIDVGAKDMGLLDGIERFDVSVSTKAALDANPQSAAVSQRWVGDGIERTQDHGLVCACHVLDHAFDLDRFMEDLEGLATANGYVFIEVHSVEAETFSARGDCFRTHNFHLPLSALTTLASRRGLNVLRADWSVEDDATNSRVLLQKGSVTSGHAMMSLMKRRYDSRYKSAAMVGFGRKDPNHTVLYGASGSYYEILRHNPEISRFRLFDTYRHGQAIKGVEVEHPDNMGSVEEIIICTVHEESTRAIHEWLAKHKPGIKVTEAFPSKP